MFRSTPYIPILKGKQGEFLALKELPEDTKNLITPLIEIPKAGTFQRKKKVYQKTLSKHLKEISDKIEKAWKGGRPIFLDFSYIESNWESDDCNCLINMFYQLWSKNVFAYPAKMLEPDEVGGNYHIALENLVDKSKSEICIRILFEDLLDIDQLNYDLEETMDNLSATPEKAHIVLDLKEIKGDINFMETIVIKTINNIADVNKWKTFTVAGSSHPQSLTEINRDSIGKISRKELILWAKIIKNQKKIMRIPGFGDYGIVHHEPFDDFDPITMTIGSKIKYTSMTNLVVLKGHKLDSENAPGNQQYPVLAKKLVGLEEYKGKHFSWGDDYINRCALREVEKCGSAMQWVAVGTNHHLELVSEQVANFP